MVLSRLSILFLALIETIHWITFETGPGASHGTFDVDLAHAISSMMPSRLLLLGTAR